MNTASTEKRVFISYRVEFSDMGETRHALQAQHAIIVRHFGATFGLLYGRVISLYNPTDTYALKNSTWQKVTHVFKILQLEQLFFVCISNQI